jgi:hypothetical protein
MENSQQTTPNVQPQDNNITENSQQSTPNVQPQDYNRGGYNRQQSDVITVGDWMITILIMIIPLINIIMLFVWAFSGGPKVSKANWAKASLLWLLIMIVIYIIIFAIIGGALLSGFFK